MKKLFLIAFALFAAIALAGCTDKDEAPVAATGIELDRPEATLISGTTLQLKATVTPADAVDAVVWSSNDTAVATVTDAGLVEAVAGGTAVVTAKCGNFSAACTIRVKDPVSAIELDRTEATLDRGTTLQLTAKVTPEDASDAVVWSSDNTDVATVSDAGLVEAVAAGTATVTAKCGEFTATCAIRVVEHATAIELDRTEAALYVGKNLQLTATVTPAGAVEPVAWSSNNTDVVKVSDTGLVEALAAGTATVTAKCGEYSATCTIDVSRLISFEATEKMTGIDGNDVALRTISVVSGTKTDQFSNVYWAKEFTEANDMRDDYDQLFFASPLFATSDSNVWFSSYYCDCTIYGAQYDAWGGFVLSSNVNKSVPASQAGVGNQFEAYADGGANGSEIFAVCYDAKTAGMAMSADCCWPQIDFTDGSHEVVSVALANSAWTYNYFKGGAGDSYVIKIRGSLNGAETGVVMCSLIDGAEKVDAWKTFDLRPLGKVDCVTFRVESSDKYAPVYFCVDDVIIK